MPGFGDDEFRASGKRHVDLMDDRKIDVQIIGPRPFLMMGWMQPHLLAGLVALCQRRDCQTDQSLSGPLSGRCSAAAEQ